RSSKDVDWTECCMSALPPTSCVSSPPKPSMLRDYVALALPEVAKSSPYAARYKRKLKKPPAVLAPLRKHSATHAIAVAESRVVKAILSRADLVQEMRLLCREASKVDRPTATSELARRLGDATNTAVLTLLEWRAAKRETAAHARAPATPSFRWQGAPYLTLLARETLDVHALLNISTPPNPFFVSCELEAVAGCYKAAADSLLQDADFLLGWQPPCTK
ncbi:hypothetical protein SDRG_03172, partial [Saprolegnia diclina VS20]